MFFSPLRQRWVARVFSVLVLLCAAFAAGSVCAGTRSYGGDPALDLGEYHACGLMEDGQPACWGSNPGAAPREPFAKISVGFDHACALRGNGQIACWGAAASTATPPPPGAYVAVSAGNADSCAIRGDGAIRCWGGELSVNAPTTGAFVDIGVGNGRACAVRGDGTLQCWQAPGFAGFGAAPGGRFLAVSVGTSHACALRSDGKIQCWGSNAQGQTAAPSAPNFVAVASGHQHACGIKEDGGIACWGANPSGQLNAPAGKFVAISAGRLHTCARNDEAVVRCWGGTGTNGELNVPYYDFQKLAVGPDQACALVYLGDIACTGATTALTPPIGRYNRVSFGTNTTCALGVDGRPTCWGVSLGTPPDEPLTAISVGAAHVCGIRVDGNAVCWGDNASGQATPEPGEYMAIASGDTFTCAQRTDTGIVCWGQGAAVDDAPEGAFASLSAHGGNACVLGNAGNVQCWGADAATLQPPAEMTFSYIAVGAHHVCGIRQSGAVALQCWGDNAHGQLQPPTGTGYYRIAAYGDSTCANNLAGMACWGALSSTLPSTSLRMAPLEIAAGDAHTCTVRGQRGVRCWGDDTLGQRAVPRHRAQSISANADHTCTQRAGEGARCWGDNLHDGSTPPTTPLRALDIGQFNGCGVGATGAATCWGWNVNAQSTLPTDLFRSVATGLNHSCGVRDDGTLACWGYNADGQATPPAGTYAAVDVGERHSCAIAETGVPTCWGLNTEGQTTPPDLGGATYRALASGTFHNCGILSNGGIACWGRNANGQSTPPEEGQYVSIAAGTAHTCAIRDDGGRVCWGANESGQAPQPTIGPAVLPTLTNGEYAQIDFTMTASGGYVAPNPKFYFLGGDYPPYNLEFNEYGQLLGVPQYDPGVYTFTIEARDENGVVAKRDVQLTVVNPPDTTSPQIVPRYNGFDFYTPWYNTDVELTWQVTDAESSVSATSGCETVTVTTDTDGTDFTCTATSEGGTATQTVTIRRDTVPPDTRLDQAPPAESWGSGGYYSETLAFSAVGTDLSGVDAFECGGSTGSYHACASPFPMTFLTLDTTYTMYIRAKDRAGNVDPTPAIATWIRRRDTTPPVITPTYAGTLGDNGWYVSDADLTWTVEDPHTPIVSSAGCQALHVVADTTGIASQCNARSGGGETWNYGSIKRDVTPPTVSSSLSAAPNAAGWHRQNVTVSYACVEATSGLTALCPATDIVSQDGAGIVVAGKTVRDNAGHTGTSNAVTINLDKTVPLVSTEPRTPANAFGWYRDDVTIDFTCVETLSGLTAPCPAPYTFTQQGRDLTYVVPVSDIAGNQTIGGRSLSIDRTVPTISAFAMTPPNAAGWYRSNVDVLYSCSDALSGIRVCPVVQTLTQEGAAVSSTTQTTTDYANNVSAPSNVVTVKIDKTAPTLNVTMPPATVLLNATHDFQLNATDALSGIASQSCGALNTATVGARTVTCVATDRAGNQTSRSATYKVVYGYAALSAPLSNPTQVYVVAAPRSVPFEWRLFDANGAAVTNATLTQTTVTDVACPDTGVSLPTPPAGETNSFVHLGAGAYRRNWWINYTATGCVRLEVTLNDGSVRNAIVRIVPKTMRTGGNYPSSRPPVPTSNASPSRPVQTAPTTQPTTAPTTRHRGAVNPRRPDLQKRKKK